MLLRGGSQREQASKMNIVDDVSESSAVTSSYNRTYCSLKERLAAIKVL